MTHATHPTPNRDGPPPETDEGSLTDVTIELPAPTVNHIDLERRWHPVDDALEEPTPFTTWIRHAIAELLEEESADPPQTPTTLWLDGETTEPEVLEQLTAVDDTYGRVRLTLQLPASVVTALEALRDTPIEDTIELAVVFRFERLQREQVGPADVPFGIDQETALRAHYTALTRLSRGSKESYDVHLGRALAELVRLPETYAVGTQPVREWLEEHT